MRETLASLRPGSPLLGLVSAQWSAPESAASRAGDEGAGTVWEGQGGFLAPLLSAGPQSRDPRHCPGQCQVASWLPQAWHVAALDPDPPSRSLWCSWGKKGSLGSVLCETQTEHGLSARLCPLPPAQSRYLQGPLAAGCVGVSLERPHGAGS